MSRCIEEGGQCTWLQYLCQVWGYDLETWNSIQHVYPANVPATKSSQVLFFSFFTKVKQLVVQTSSETAQRVTGCWTWLHQTCEQWSKPSGAPLQLVFGEFHFMECDNPRYIKDRIGLTLFCNPTPGSRAPGFQGSQTQIIKPTSQCCWEYHYNVYSDPFAGNMKIRFKSNPQNENAKVARLLSVGMWISMRYVNFGIVHPKMIQKHPKVRFLVLGVYLYNNKVLVAKGTWRAHNCDCFLWSHWITWYIWFIWSK